MAALLDRALDFALTKAGKDSHFRLKPQQKQIVEALVCFKKDVMGILPTGFGKSLVFHVLSDVFDFMDDGQTPEKGRSITVVISPLNALMRDQISKLSHLGAIILDGTKRGIDLATLQAREGKLQLLFSHPEILLENTTKTMLKTAAFQKNVRSIVVDEAHLVDDWWVLLFFFFNSYCLSSVIISET